MYRTYFKQNKYNAKKTVFDGYRYDSRFEAGVAADLTLRLKAKDILGFDRQYRVEIPLFDERGSQRHVVRHKVDFRVHNLDRSFTLLEAKGVETADYKLRRLFLEKFFLPNNPDYTYEVVKQGQNWYNKKR